MTPAVTQTPASTSLWYPKLDGLNLPQALVQAVRKAFDTIYSVSALASSTRALTWVLVTPKNSWVPVSTTANWVLTCAIDANGRLALAGGAKVTSYVDGTVIGVLPSASFRPSRTISGPLTVQDTTASTDAPGTWKIDTGGNIVVSSPGTTAGHAAQVFFDGISARLV